MRYILTVDSGGSKSEAAFVREDGVVLGWGACRIPGTPGRSEYPIRRAAREAMEMAGVAFRELHVASLVPILPVGIFRDMGPFTIQVHNVKEHEGPLSLLGFDSGVVVLSGTGAFVHVQPPDGEYRRYDGFGPLLGDCGSGYQIGYLAMRAAMKSFWHPRNETPLTKVVFDAFQVENRHDMIPLNFINLERSKVAVLAAEVNRVAEEGDPIATQILIRAADAMADTLRDAMDVLNRPELSMKMVGTGSVMRGSRIYWNRLCERAAEFAPQLTPVLEPSPPAAGMAMAVLRRMDGVDAEAALPNLIASTRAILDKLKSKQAEQS